MRSLTARVAAGALAVLALTLAATGVTISVLSHRHDVRLFDASLRRTAGALVPPMAGALGVGVTGDRIRPAGDGPRRALQDAVRGAGAGGEGAVRYVRGTLPDGHSLLIGQVMAGLRVVQITGPGGLRVQVGASTEGLDRRAASTRRLVILVSLAGLLVAALAVVLVSRAALRPLARLGEAASGVGDAGDLGVRVSAPGQPREVAVLAGELDAMLERLGHSVAERERALQAARRFAAEAGHELRTPLQSVRSNLELAARPGLDEAERVASLRFAAQQAERLDRLADGLQALARGEVGLQHSAGEVDLGDIADGAAFAARARHPEAQLELDAPGDGPLVRGDSDGLWRLVENLLENAARHGRDGRAAVRIRLRVGPVDGGVVVQVDDDGPGVPADDREAVLRPFERGAAPRAPGMGLGLAIVAAEAHRHGGDVRLEDSDLGGLRVMVSLASAPAAPAGAPSPASRPGR